MTPDQIAAITAITDLDALLELWKAERYSVRDGEVFAKDGLVDPKQFGQGEELRVLFVLKDPSTNGFEKSRPNGTLCDWIRAEEPRPGSTWFVVAHWAQALLDGTTSNLVPSGANQILQKIGAINLKKSSWRKDGGSNTTADNDMVDAYTLRDRDFLRQQIKLIDPDVIVGCGVNRPLAWLLEFTPEEVERFLGASKGREWACLVRTERPAIVLTKHPARAKVISGDPSEPDATGVTQPTTVGEALRLMRADLLKGAKSRSTEQAG